jgi:DNA-binding transcriptional ArsR family regulator
MKTGSEKPIALDRKHSRTAVLADRPQSKSLPPIESPRAAPLPAAAGSRWTFLTNHSHVLVLLSRDPSLVLREVARLVGITERAVQRIIADLEAGGVIEREKIGRQNRYRILADQPLRHGIIESRRTIGELLDLINGE